MQANELERARLLLHKRSCKLEWSSFMRLCKTLNAYLNVAATLGVTARGDDGSGR